MKKIALLLASVVALHVAHAQDTTNWPAADPADVSSVDAIIGAVYDVISGPAGEVRDWDRFRSLFHPQARLIPSTRSQDGTRAVIVWDVDAYVDRVHQQFVDSGFFERELHRETDAFGPIVQVFSTYESRRTVDGDPIARGINSFQLFNDGARWWVVNVFWESERPGQPIPEEYGG